MNRNREDHRRRRKAWDRGFSVKGTFGKNHNQSMQASRIAQNKSLALNTYEPRIKNKVDLLITHLLQTNGPIDITAWANYLAFDIMGDVGFSKEFGCVANETEHPAIQSIHEHLAVIGIIGHIPWLLYLAARIPGAAAAYSGFFSWCGDEMDAKIKVRVTSSDSALLVLSG